MLRKFVAITPLAGAIIFPLVIPLIIAKVGMAQGVLAALILSLFWFVSMLTTSEMPH